MFEHSMTTLRLSGPGILIAVRASREGLEILMTPES